LLVARRLSRLLGFDPRGPLGTIKNLPSFIHDWRLFRERQQVAETKFPFDLIYPILGQKKEAGGTASGHYFHQDLLVARRIFQRRPEKHVDIGSRVDGFVAHVASFRAIELFDIRPMNRSIPNVTFRVADFMSLPDEYVSYSDSVSCLHALEHFGLGRYGDPIDPDGHLKGLAALSRLVKAGGVLYLSVPIGPDRIEFNAHRVFSVPYLRELFGGNFELMAFSYVDDAGDLHENVSLDDRRAATSFDCHYGCGIFELRRLATGGGVTARPPASAA
jgi:SAM-dependent methyltransferase